MADAAVLQARLSEAESALHTLMIGGATVSVRYEGQEFTRKPADLASLRGYIADLKAQLGVGGRVRGRRLAH